MTAILTAPVIAPQQAYAGAPLLRTEVTLDPGHGPVSRARLRVGALGVFEAYIDGARVGDDVLAPGWTSYEWRIRVCEYDVTDMLPGSGESLALGLALGRGWWAGRLGWGPADSIYSDRVGAAVELSITFADGHTQVVGSDEDWGAGPSAVTANQLYDGQEIDARRLDPHWCRVGFVPTSDWGGVERIKIDPERFVEPAGPAIRRQQEISPRSVNRSPSGKVLVDFGQNLVGWVRMRVTGPAGRTVTVRHAEVLEAGELGVRPLRTARATDAFTLSGGADEFEPTFTLHGFRYVEVDGWPGTDDELRDAVTAVVVHSDLRRTGTFACSDPLLTRLHENVVWGMRGNFVGVPTDCPQRDERLGWTGDIAVFAPTAAHLYDVSGFLGEWLTDVASEARHNDDVVPWVVPDILKYSMPADSPERRPTAVWSDAGAWVPWALWQAYGDRAALAEQYPLITATVRRARREFSDAGVWEGGFQFGDWLDPDAPADDPAAAKADVGVVATACAYRSATIAARAAEILGLGADAAEFTSGAETLRAAFRTRYVDGGLVASDCATAYALAIMFDLLEGDEEAVAGARLASLVADADHRISTGFAGTPFVTDALSRTGHMVTAYRLLTQRECPSWLYPVTMGATTIWERWDSMLPDGSINPGEMTSFNHYALGAVADWMHRVVAGLTPLAPGYSEVLIAPRPGGGITWAETALDTRHGRIAVAWEQQVDGLHVHIEVPAGVSAVMRLDGDIERRFGQGVHDVVGVLF